MIEIKQEFSDRELKWFGPLFALFIGIIDMILVRRFQWVSLAVVLSALAAGLIVAYYLMPSRQKSIYRGWMYSVAPIGWVVSHVLLGLIYYFVLTPIALLLKTMKHDPMERMLLPQAATYWKTRPPQRKMDQYFRQF